MIILLILIELFKNVKGNFILIVVIEVCELTINSILCTLYANLEPHKPRNKHFNI